VLSILAICEKMFAYFGSLLLGISELLRLPAETGISEYYSRNADRWITTLPSSTVNSLASNAVIPMSSGTDIHPLRAWMILLIVVGSLVAISLVAMGFCYYQGWKSSHQEPVEKDTHPPESTKGRPKNDEGPYIYTYKAELPADIVRTPRVKLDGTSS
jgi:hypothetical protein